MLLLPSEFKMFATYGDLYNASKQTSETSRHLQISNRTQSRIEYVILPG